MCIDFTDLNKACPKDPFPMPKIDQLVDATVDHPRMSFLEPSRVIIRYLWPWTIRKKRLLLPLLGTTITK